MIFVVVEGLLLSKVCACCIFVEGELLAASRNIEVSSESFFAYLSAQGLVFYLTVAPDLLNIGVVDIN